MNVGYDRRFSTLYEGGDPSEYLLYTKSFILNLK